MMPLMRSSPIPRRACGRALIGFVLSLSWPWVRAEQPVAVIVDTSPGVSVHESGIGARAVILRNLQPGADVQLEGQARVVLLFIRSGVEYTLTGSGTASLDAESVRVTSGAVAVERRVPQPGREVRVSPARVTVGGIALRHFPVRPATNPRVSEQEIAERRPEPSASLAARVTFALWLEEVGATEEAKASWKALAAERPDQASLAARAR